MSECSERKQALAKALHTPHMKALNFRRHADSWNRTNRSGWVEVVNLQANSGNFHNQCEVTMNLGVYIPAAATWSRSNPKYVKEYECHFRERLNMLIVGQDHWWLVPAQPDALASQIAQALSTYGIPWFNEYGDIASLEQKWQLYRQSTQLNFPLLETLMVWYARNGQKQKAEEVLQAQLNDLRMNGRKTDWWTNFARELGLSV